jgi:hypothetical protein
VILKEPIAACNWLPKTISLSRIPPEINFNPINRQNFKDSSLKIILNQAKGKRDRNTTKHVTQEIPTKNSQKKLKDPKAT